MKTLKLLIAVTLTLGHMSSSIAQKQGEKTLLQQLNEEEESEKRKNIYQGQSQPASQSLQKARDNAKYESTTYCPSGSIRRKIEDVREYLMRQDEILKKFAASLERFTTKEIDRNSAIDESNKIIMESNDLVLWARGKITDGPCGTTKQTEILGKARGATQNLMDEYKRALQ